MNLKFKSSEPDLKFNIQSHITILNKNILYLTHTMDKCLYVLKQMQDDKNLQKQVDQYFGNDAEHFEETSPQTDSVNKNDPD